MEVIKEIFKIIDILTTTYLIYFIITGLLVLKENRKIKDAKEKHKFAILVPAKNEEKVIGNLLKSLNKQEYPKDMYDVYVIANNCTDNTKKISLENNANLIECDIRVKSKGDALRRAFNKLDKEDYEAYIIFDADNIVHPKFISKMNNALEEGYEIAQGFRDSKNVSDTWVSGSYSIHYLIHNAFLNKSRMNIDKSSFVNGTGFMISKKLLYKRGYKAHTLTEDIELTVRCALAEDKIAFVEDAITYDEQPTTFKESWKQRKRWSIGTIQCFKIYFTKLFKKGIRENGFSALDVLIFLSAPFLQFISGISYVSHFIISILEGEYINYGSKLFTLVVWYFVSILISILAIKLNKKHIRPYIKGIAMLPVFLLTWIPINMIACFRQKSDWEKIEHTRDVPIEKVLEVDYK